MFQQIYSAQTLQFLQLPICLFDTEDKEEHVSILEESAALRAVSVREQLAAAGNNNSMEMVAVAILAELQEEQDREVALTLDLIENMVSYLNIKNKC